MHGSDRLATALYSVGYQGRTAEQLVATVRLAGVDVVLDVRLNPISRKPGLSKRQLAALLAEAGIEYLHEPLLGNPRDNRDGFRDEQPQAARSRFAQRLSDVAHGALLELVHRARNMNVALLCYEADARHCHRQVICEAAQAKDPALRVVAL